MTATDDPNLTSVDGDAPGDAPVQGDYVEGDEEEFLPARRRRTGPLTVTLALLLVAALGVFGGVQLQKNRGKTTTTSAASGGAARAAAAGFPGFGGGGGGGTTNGTGPAGAPTGSGGSGGGGQGGGTTFGTVKLVDGTTIYVTASDGSIVKVTTTPGSTTITRSVTGVASDLQPGQTVVVQGAAGADGTVAATSVTEGGLGGAGRGRGAGTGGTGG